MNIQTPFADAELLSLAELAELKARLEQDSELSARQQREMISAINTTAKWLNLPAEMIPSYASSCDQAAYSKHQVADLKRDAQPRP
mgnify:CR=1 FL=1|tara:strand:- start:367 stop:624 length:258 start_codon:yes stop_codon:yes gene_type:complete